MDANATRHWILLGRDDWAACVRPDLGGQALAARWPADAGADTLRREGWEPALQALTLPREAFRFRAGRADRTPDARLRRGAGADPFGHILFVAPEGDGVLRQCAREAQAAALWPPAAEADMPVGVASGLDGADRVLTAGRTPSFAGPGQPAFGPQAAPAAWQAALAGLCVTPAGRAIFGSLAPAGLLDLDLLAGGAPRWHAWPAPPAGTRAFMPCDLAAHHECVWVLDRALPGNALSPVAVDARLWRLDPRLGTVAAMAPAASQPGDFSAPGPHRAPQPVPASRPDFAAAGVLAARDPIAVEALPDGRALVLDRPLAAAAGAAAWGRLLVVGAAPAAAPVALSLDVLGEIIAPEDQGAAPPQAGQALAVTPAQPAGDGPAALARVWLVADDGNQCFLLLLVADAAAPGGLRLEPQPVFYPMRRYTGAGLVAAGADLWYPCERVWVPLVAQRRPRFDTTMVVDSWPGTTGRPPLDAGEPGCVWHRVVIDLALPAGCALRLQARAGDTPEALRQAPWRAQPLPVPRALGPELPWLARAPEAATAEQMRSVELLLQAVRGRYAQLRLELSGNGLATPRVFALRVWYPRFSYLRYLPACWREDPQAADFLERLLANMEGSFTTWEDRIAAVQLLFDARSAPREHLPWLAAWLGWVLDARPFATLDERRRRLLLRHGHRLLARRGTLPALQRLVRLLTDPCSDESLFARDDALPERPGDIRYVERPEGRAHTLAVRVPVSRQAPDAQARIAQLRDILAIALPAHVVAELGTADTEFRLGSARLGFETRLAPDIPIAPAIVDRATLGATRLAGSPEPGVRPGLGMSRLGHLEGLV